MAKNNTFVISVDKVKVLSSPFSYVHVNSLQLKLEKHSNDQDDITMDVSYDIVTGEWLPHEHHDLILAIDTKNVPKELLLTNEKIMNPTTSFLNLNRKHKFFSVNNEKVVISQPYVNTSGNVTMTVRLAAHKYALSQLTSPPLKKVDYTGVQVNVSTPNEDEKLTDKYQLSPKNAINVFQNDCGIDLAITLGGHEARKVMNIKDFRVGLRMLGGTAGHLDLSMSLDQFPSLIVAKESKSQSVKVTIAQKKLWSSQILTKKTIDARLSLFKDSNNLKLEHIDKDIKNLNYLTPGYDYEISFAETKINYY